ncbi:MAG: PAS domain S-box protein [Desulfobacterales bacterium]|nr:PAS domain S-box protein [Desulfobacterales bacterium]
MKGENTKLISITEKLIWIGIGLAVLFWILESAVHVFIFHEGNLAQQIFSPHSHEIWMRLIVVAAFIAFAIYAQFIINQRRRAEEATKHAHAELNQIFSTAADGMRVVDKDFNVLRVNETFSTLSGISNDEAAGKKCYEVFRGHLCHTPECPLTRILGGEERVEFDVEKQRSDGVTVPCIVTATPFVGSGGELVGIVEDFKDISERKRVYEQLQESEEKYKTLIESSLTGTFIHQDGKYVFVSDRFAEIHGYEPGELPGKESLSLVHPDEREALKEIASKRLDGGDVPERYEIRRLAKDGKTIWCEMMATRIEYAGRPAIMGNIMDISERKQAEAALQKARDELEQRVEERTAKLARTTEQLKLELTGRMRVEKELRLTHKDLAIYADELQAANEELSEYAYVAAHDLKAPLRAIRNYTDFLCEDLEESLDGDQKTYLDGLKLAVRQGEELAEDLLAFTEVGRRSGSIKTIDTGIFLRELIASLNLSSDVEVVMGDDWPTIDTEPTLLRQIFQDLIKNAVKFNHSPRKRVELGWSLVGEDRYEVFVHDNGIGIEPRHYEQIFRVFQRLHSRKEFAGTGLGLAIVRKAAGKLHGSVRVESKPGQGSTFFIALPKTKKET